jgi:hypothetical protein
MGCVLKAEGTNFMVDAFIEQSALKRNVVRLRNESFFALFMATAG